MDSPRSRIDLSGKTAVVTGASSGIGAGIAAALAEAGMSLTLCGRDAARLATSARVVQRHGGECVEVVGDLSDAQMADAIVQGAVGAFGRIDCLVHSAGVHSAQSFLDTPVDELDRQYAVNVRAPFALTQAAAPHMSNGSTVIFIGSNLASAPEPGTIAYSSTKSAVHTVARIAAVELAPRGIRVNVIAPGVIQTPMSAWLIEDPSLATPVRSQTPSGFFGTPHDVAAAAVYLASDVSRYVLGSILTIDGGWSVR